MEEKMEKVIENREQRLAQINEELTKRNLKTLGKLGDVQKGEWEILGILNVLEYAKQYWTTIQFAILFPNGKKGTYTMHFNANGIVSDGAVMVVLINGKHFVLIKQWRPAMSRWTWEIPRGFGEKMDTAKIHGKLGTMRIGDLPLGTLTRELGEEAIEGGEVVSITHLGNIAQNSSNDTATPSYFFVQISVKAEKLEGKLKGTEGLAVKLLTLNEIKNEMGGKIVDAHSITALALVLKLIETMPRYEL